MYIYGGFTLLYGRNQHNIVKQLSSNFKKKKKKENKDSFDFYPGPSRLRFPIFT